MCLCVGDRYVCSLFFDYMRAVYLCIEYEMQLVVVASVSIEGTVNEAKCHTLAKLVAILICPISLNVLVARYDIPIIDILLWCIN